MGAGLQGSLCDSSVFPFYVVLDASCLVKRQKRKQKLNKGENKMSEPIEVITLCVAGLGALSTLAVALFSHPAKPGVKKSVQCQFEFDEDKPATKRTKDKVLAGHH
jgi:hypothetical protein